MFTRHLRRLLYFALAALLGAAWLALALPLKARCSPTKHAPPRPAPGPRQLWTPPRALDEVIYSTDVPKSIPDGPGGVVYSELVLANSDLVRDLNVYVFIEHTWVRDLRVSVLRPGPRDTLEVLLLDLLPIDSAVNLRGWFDDEAGVGIHEADTPLVGVWRPLGTLARFDDSTAAGRWLLRVEDRFALDTGRIVLWGVDLNPAVNLQGTVRDASTRQGIPQAQVAILETGQRTLTNSVGRYDFSGLAPDTYTVRFTAAYYDTVTVPGVIIAAGTPTTLDTALVTHLQQVVFRSTSAPVPIPDLDRASMTLPADADFVIVDIDVVVNVTHTFVGDISLILHSPGGVRDTLVFVGAECDPIGADMRNCRFDDEASLPVDSGRGPFTGSWRPYRPLSVFDGRHTRGTWRLEALDHCEADTGRIDSFALYVTGQPASGSGRETVLRARAFAFDGNYPNPFNATTIFRFHLWRSGVVALVLYDLLGREVVRVASGNFSAGAHEIAFDGSYLPSGVYIARLTAGGHTESRKVVLLK